jgi:hypothetical protein
VPAAGVFVVVLVPLSILQLALVFGALWGGSRGRSAPVLLAQLRIGSAVALVLYAAFAVVILDRADRIDVLTESVAVIDTRVVFGSATLGVILNAISQQTAPAHLQPSDQ